MRNGRKKFGIRINVRKRIFGIFQRRKKLEENFNNNNFNKDLKKTLNARLL